MQKRIIFLNLFIMVVLFGFVLTGWVVGDAIRHSKPELRRYPVETLSVKELSIFRANPTHQFGGVTITNWVVPAWRGCKDEVIYTSLPAKCHSMDGRLIEVGGNPDDIFIIPSSEWEK